MSSTTRNLALTKPAGSETYGVSVQNDNMDKIDAAFGLVDISSHFTVNSTYCEDFKAYKFGHIVIVSMIVKAGTPDQTNIITNIDSGYRPLKPVALSTFWMNWSDQGKSVVGYCMTSAIQIRTNANIEGSGGVLVSGCYMI